MPLEFIFYRTIKQLLFQHEYLKNEIDFDVIYNKYNIKDYIEIFDQLEKNWQTSMVDEDVYDFYMRKCERIISIEDIKFKFNELLGNVYKEKDELYAEFNKISYAANLFEKEIERLNNELIKVSKELDRINNEDLILKNELSNLREDYDKKNNELEAIKQRKLYKLMKLLDKRGENKL